MAVIPKPASTVVLMDKSERVYLTRRPKTMKFLGGVFVFPGGAVDKEDHVNESHYIKDLSSSLPLHQSHYIAGARELFEEVGILLATKDDGSPIRLEKERELQYRKQLVQGELSFIQLLEMERLYLNLESLTYFGALVTPEDSPYRFDTRFFLAEMPEGQTPAPDMHEIDEAFWMTPKEALLACKNGEMPMVTPTILSLRTLINYQNGGALKLPEIKDLKVLR